MIFASGIFLFCFLPIFLAVYYAAPKAWRTPIIVIASYTFYAWWRVDYLALLIAVTLWSYWLGKAISHEGNREKAQHWLWLGVAINVGTLGYFKYTNFGIDGVNLILQSAGMSPLGNASILLPIGISFFIFQAISYLVDIYRGDAPAARSLVDLAAFKALFPQLIAGPVLRYKDIAHQFSSRTHTWEKFGEGWRRFALGLAMKVLLADPLAPLADRVFALESPSLTEAWLGALAYSAQLFFDFAGYSSMAVGLGLMIGFRFLENFATPYSARSITEFWQRWHISLSTWLRDYLYIPLGGNRHGTFNTARNLVLTMTLGGLWHGANWTFVIWGLWHGAWMVAERIAGRKSLWPQGLETVGTFSVVLLGWVVFRSADLEGAQSMLMGLAGGNGVVGSQSTAWMTTNGELASLAIAYLAILFGIVRSRTGWFSFDQNWLRGAAPLVTIVLFGLASSRLAAASSTPFLYFQF